MIIMSIKQSNYYIQFIINNGNIQNVRRKLHKDMLKAITQPMEQSSGQIHCVKWSHEMHNDTSSTVEAKMCVHHYIQTSYNAKFVKVCP